MTTIRIEAAPGRARCTLTSGLLRPQVLDVDATGARVALVATGATLLGGDRIDVDLHVGAGAWLEVVEVAGTTAFPLSTAPTTTTASSVWSTRIHVEAGGTLLWPGEPIVISAGAALHRELVETLEAGATMATRETLILGRSGEIGGSMQSTTRVDYNSIPLFVEELALDGPIAGHSEPLRRDYPGILYGARCVDSVLMFGIRPETSGPSDRLDLEGPGCIARDIRSELHTSRMADVWMQWRSNLLLQRTSGQDVDAMMRSRSGS